MADELFIEFRDTLPPGQKFAPEVVAEIRHVAPSQVENGSVGEAELADKAVTEPKIADGAVTSPKIATKGVKTVNIDDEAVGTPQLAPDAVTPEKCGTGVSTAVDFSGNPIEDRTMFLTAEEYASITAPDPNTTYEILG